MAAATTMSAEDHLAELQSKFDGGEDLNEHETRWLIGQLRAAWHREEMWIEKYKARLIR